MNKERFGSFVRARRTAADLSRRLYAEKLGISESFLIDIEFGKSVPSKERLFDWAVVLGVSPERLFEELEEPIPGGKAPLRSIPIPYDFPGPALHQVEDFVKFLQYQSEFEQFLKLYENYRGEGERPTAEEFKKSVEDYFDRTHPAANDKGTGKGKEKEKEVS